MAYEGRSLSQTTADRLTDIIMDSGEFPPGSKIPNENELSARFGVSRTTLREAIRTLEVRGVVEVRRGTGTFVAAELPMRGAAPMPDLGEMLGELRDIYELRQIFEPETAALACERATEEELRLIAELADKIEEAGGDAERRTEADTAFHVAIIKAAHNDFILRFIPVVEQAMSDVRFLEAQKGSLDLSMTDHKVIVSFLNRRDAAGARCAAFVHLRRMAESLHIDDKKK